MKKAVCYCFGLSSILFSCALAASAKDKAKQGSPLRRVYKVNKKVCDFPEKEDFSTPEAAYAVIGRVLASGEQSTWRRISVKSLANRLPSADAKKEQVKPKIAKMYLNARILEVRIFRGDHAVVISKINHPSGGIKFDGRIVGREDGRWLNKGHSHYRTIDQARAKFAGSCARRDNKDLRLVRPKVKDPEAYLKPFVDFLKTHGKDPKAFVMNALATHKIVIMGEIHHRPRYWAFNASLVTDPDFAKRVGVIYMGLPSNDQNLVDQFLAADSCDTKLIIEMLRDNLWMGWPDQPMLDFFVKVWIVNQDLPANERLRIILVDMQRPWKDIKERKDWRKYNVNRDRFMAQNILKDLREHPQEKRNTLFIVGVAHTMLNFRTHMYPLPAKDGAPMESAGWHLRKELGPENIFAIMQHQAVGTNWGDVKGRVCMGLFDSAFAELGNKPMAFPLDVGPFGKEPFDALADRPVMSTYRDGYSAYLYLGPLETEMFSPLIPGFYTDEFVKELERRHRMMYRKGWAESYRLPKSDAQSFIAWMGNSWGKPRRNWRKWALGPMDAWHRGGRDWKKAIQDEKITYAMEHPEEVVQAAEELFAKIRNADYAYTLGYLSENGRWKEDGWKKFPAHNYYMVSSNWAGWAEWICKTFIDNPIVSVKVGNMFPGKEVIIGRKGWPTVPYKLTLKDGSVLEGNLPFEYNFDGGKGHWHGMEGLDWHKRYKSGLSPGKPRSNSNLTELKATPFGKAITKADVLVDRSSPKATVISWTKAVATKRKQDALSCMLPDGKDYDDVERILDADSSSKVYSIRKMWEAINPEKPVKVVDMKQHGKSASITWEVTFKSNVSVKGRTFKSGDTLKMDARLKNKGNVWLIDGM